MGYLSVVSCCVCTVVRHVLPPILPVVQLCGINPKHLFLLGPLCGNDLVPAELLEVSSGEMSGQGEGVRGGGKIGPRYLIGLVRLG